MPTKLEANASFKKPRLVFLVLALALIFGAVCVGGVSGATHYVYANHNLADIVNNANDGDVIVIMEDYVIKKQVVLSSERVQTGGSYLRPTYSYITRTITITNAPGVDVTISSNLGVLSSSDNTVVDTRTLFKIHAGKLIVKGNDEGGSLSFTSNYKGRVFDVNFDEIKSGNEDDGLGATLEMHEGVRVYQSGFITENIAQSNNGGAVYIRSQGIFIMHGGLLTDNKAGGGGAVCVDNGGSFKLIGGLISNNDALYTGNQYAQKWGGGVWASAASLVEWTGGEIKGNTAMAQSPNGEDYNEIYPKITPPQKKESPIYVSAGSTTYDYYWSIKEAYDDMKKKNVKTFTIYIRRDFSQGYIEKWKNNAYVTELDKVTIDKDYSVTIKPDKTSITLNLMFDQMFKVSSGGSLTVSGNNGASLTISGKNEVNTVETGGFVLVNGGSFEVQNGVTISSTKAKNGGAIYLKSGSCTLSGSASITGCTASEKGGAVYVADGTFTVKDSASVDASNDVYLEDGEVITAESGYKGTIGKITLSDYEDGRNVVDITANPGISAEKFVLNSEAHNEYGDKLLVSVDEKSKKYLELKNQIEFLITIPDALYISESSNSGSMIVTADKVRIPKDTWISVTVTSTGNFNLTHSSVDSAKLPYNLFVDDSGVRVTNNLEVAKFTVTEYLDKQTQNLKPTKSLTATVTELPPMTGTYTDTLTFTAEHIDRAFS